jgi:hypothetical protein
MEKKLLNFLSQQKKANYYRKKMHFKSNLEEKVYDALRATGTFTSGFSCIKEYPWKKLFENAPRNTNAVDFYYPDLKLVIEVNGEQHYRPVSFGEQDGRVVLDRLQSQKQRDRHLRRLCREESIILLELHYTDIRDREVPELAKYLEGRIMGLI